MEVARTRWFRPLNTLYLELERELSVREVATMKSLLTERQVDKGDVENVETARDLFDYLEDMGHIAVDNLTLLIVLFEAIDRRPLKEFIVKYLQDSGDMKKRDARELLLKASLKEYKLLPPGDQFSKTAIGTFYFIATQVYASVDHDLSKQFGILTEVEDHLEKVGVWIEKFRSATLECLIKCFNMDVLEKLWSQYKSGVLQEVFQKAIITDQLLESLQAEYIIMELTISEDEYRKCRQEVRVWEEVNKAWEERVKALSELDKAIDEKYDQAEEEFMKADEKFWKEHVKWISIGRSTDDFEAANVHAQTMKDDVRYQTHQIDKEMKMISAQLEIKGVRMKELKANLPSKSDDQIDHEIRELKRQLKTETLSTEVDGIKAKIDSLEQSKGIIKEYLEVQSAINSDRNKQECLEKERKMYHEKAERLEDIEEKVLLGLSRMTISDGEDLSK